jgi:hypothetical protein
VVCGPDDESRSGPVAPLRTSYHQERRMRSLRSDASALSKDQDMAISEEISADWKSAITPKKPKANKRKRRPLLNATDEHEQLFTHDTLVSCCDFLLLLLPQCDRPCFRQNRAKTKNESTLAEHPRHMSNAYTKQKRDYFMKNLSPSVRTIL